MAELSDPSFPPSKKTSPCISSRECPKSAFGISGPNISKKGKENEKATFFHVGQILNSTKANQKHSNILN